MSEIIAPRTGDKVVVIGPNTDFSLASVGGGTFTGWFYPNVLQQVKDADLGLVFRPTGSVDVKTNLTFRTETNNIIV